MTDTDKENLKNCDATESACEPVEGEKQEKRRGRPKKAKQDKEVAATSFEFSDADIAEFKAWKEARKIESKIQADSPEDDKIYRMWKEESRMVKGIFRCRDPEGGCVTFCYRKYRWDPTRWYTLYDGEVYELPLGVARHLNQNCNYPVHSHILGPDGNPTVDRTGKVKSRMNFESTEFAVA